MENLSFDIGPLAGDALRANAELLSVLLQKIPAATKNRVHALVASGCQVAVEAATDRKGAVRLCLTIISPDARRTVLARLQTVDQASAPKPG